MTIRKKKISNLNIRPHRILKPWATLSVGGKIWRTIGVALCALWVGTFFQVLLFKFVEPPFTPYMFACHNEQRKDPNLSEQYYRICVPIEDISPNMLKAAILGEDGRFLYHHGFSFKGLREAYLKNEVEGHIVRGGSSISQQTAKNCFLPFNRNLFRKLVEAHYTFLIENCGGRSASWSATSMWWSLAMASMAARRPAGTITTTRPRLSPKRRRSDWLPCFRIRRR